MEVPVINRLGEFESAITCSLAEPSFLAPSFSIHEIVNIFQAYSFWKWGAFILAFIATFSGVFNRIKFIIIKFQKQSFTVSEPLLRYSDYEDFSDEDDDNDVSLTYSSEVDDDLDYDSESSVDKLRGDYNDYRIAGQNSDMLDDKRRDSIGDRFSLSEFVGGGNVVKLWDGMGLGLNLDNSSGNIISIYDLNRAPKLSSGFTAKCQIPAISALSPLNFISTGVESSRNVGLKVWDPRVECQIPAILAEWKPVIGKVVGINGELTVRDMKNINLPLENVTESDGETWWDADAVVVSKDCEDDDTAEYYRNSVGSRCRDAVLAYLF